ncbi:hypothetical protein [Glycomyces terrestris]|nr:hypothetical protein [Glycomyces terrestris]
MAISEDEYQRRLEATEEMSVAELGDYVRGTLGIAPPDDEPGWYVRVDFVDSPAGRAERFTWQRTIRHVIEPGDISPEG